MWAEEPMEGVAKLLEALQICEDLQGTLFLLVSNLQYYIPREDQKILKFRSKSVLKKFILINI